MKKFLSLLLVVAMLLSVAPMTWAAEEASVEPKHAASLLLKDSIAINFKVSKAWLDAKGATKVEMSKGGEVVKTYTSIPTLDGELAVFPFTDLTPYEMDADVTVTYYAGEEVLYTYDYSVLDYCSYKLQNDSNILLKTALYDMLAYGAAAQVANGQEVGADLQTALNTYASCGTTAAPTLANKSALTGEEGSVKWLSAGLNLKDAVTLRLKFSAASTEGLVLKLTSNGKTWSITKFEAVENEQGSYYAYFNGLNPAQMRDVLTGEFFDAEGNAVSNKLTYSVESYAAIINAGSYTAEMKALTKALMTYADSVYTWAYTYMVGSDVTYIEAEDIILYQDVDTTMYNASTTLTKPVVILAEDEKASGSQVAKLDWSGRLSTGSDDKNIDYAEKPAHLTFNVLAEETATYYIWVRFYGGTASSKTIYTHIDGKETTWTYQLVDNDGNAGAATGEYSWHRLVFVSWTAGESYTVRLRTRDGAMSFDQFVVTTDVSFAPFMENGFASVKLDTFVEAETVTLNPSFTDVTNSKNVSNAHKTYVDNASGNQYLQLKNPTNNDQLFIFTENNSAAPAAAFQVTADAPGTYYVWARVLLNNAMYTSVSGSATQYTYEFFRGSELKDPSRVGEDNWYQIGTYTATEAGEVFYVRLLDRSVYNLIDQFYVTSAVVATPHEHTYSADWSTDADYHWYECTVDGCDGVKDKGIHVYDDDQDATCNTCSYEREIHVHTFEENWTITDTHHWKAATCGCAELTSNYGEHDYGTTGVCTCGKVSFYVIGSEPVTIEAEDVNLFTTKDPDFGNMVPTQLVDDGTAVYMGGANYGAEEQGGTLAQFSAHVSFNVKVSQGGTYYVWAKVRKNSATPTTLTLINGDTANTAQTWKYASWKETTEYTYVMIATCDWTDANKEYFVGLRGRQQHSIIDKFVITSDKNFTPHDHVYDTETWATDETHHYHACTVAGCTAAIDKAAHDFGTTGVCTCGKVGFYAVSNEKTYIEAENVNLFTESDKLMGKVVVSTVEDATASNGSHVTLGQGGVNNGDSARETTDAEYPAHISFTVKASTTGKYYVWARAKSTNTSVTASQLSYIDGISSRTAGASIKEGSWQYDCITSAGEFTWVRIAICNEWVEGQTYSVRLRARQQQIAIDQFMVTSDSTFTPT